MATSPNERRDSLPSEPIGMRARSNTSLFFSNPNDDSEDPIRNWCTGLPPRKTSLGPNSAPARRVSESEELAARYPVPLEYKLKATEILVQGQKFIPMTAENIELLTPFEENDLKFDSFEVFKGLMIDQEINDVHADHVFAAFKFAGVYCESLIITLPIKTSGNDAFYRDSDDINLKADWEHLFEMMPLLEMVTIEHYGNEPTELSRETAKAIHQALTNLVEKDKLLHLKPEGIIWNISIEL